MRRKCDGNTSSDVDGQTNAGDIASPFADKYCNLYTSVSYNDTEMSYIRSYLTELSVLSETLPVVDCADVMHECGQLKAGNRDSRNENDIVNERFVSSIVNNSSRNFWYEDRCMRRKCDSNTSSVVDGQTNAGDIASSFADKYSNLYTSVSYNDTEMSYIRSYLTELSVLSETLPVAVSYTHLTLPTKRIV